MYWDSKELSRGWRGGRLTSRGSDNWAQNQEMSKHGLLHRGEESFWTPGTACANTSRKDPEGPPRLEPGFPPPLSLCPPRRPLCWTTMDPADGGDPSGNLWGRMICSPVYLLDGQKVPTNKLHAKITYILTQHRKSVPRTMPGSPRSLLEASSLFLSSSFSFPGFVVHPSSSPS